MEGGVSGLGNPGGGKALEVQEIREEGGSKTLAIHRGVWIFSGITQWTRKSFCNRCDEDVCSQALITRFTIKGKAGNIVRLRTEENWKVSLIIRKYLLSLIPFVCSQ